MRKFLFASFCYLGGMISVGSGCVSVAVARAAQEKFRELLPIMMCCYITSCTCGSVFNPCVYSMLVNPGLLHADDSCCLGVNDCSLIKWICDFKPAHSMVSFYKHLGIFLLGLFCPKIIIVWTYIETIHGWRNVLNWTLSEVIAKDDWRKKTWTEGVNNNLKKLKLKEDREMFSDASF